MKHIESYEDMVAMKLHETASDNAGGNQGGDMYYITRVPGGWLYTGGANENGVLMTATFVPLVGWPLQPGIDRPRGLTD